MFKLMDKKITAILRSKILLNWPYAKATLNDHADVFIGVRDLMSKPSSSSILCVFKKGRLQ